MLEPQDMLSIVSALGKAMAKYAIKWIARKMNTKLRHKSNKKRYRK
jgi:hypothetical protein